MTTIDCYEYDSGQDERRRADAKHRRGSSCAYYQVKHCLASECSQASLKTGGKRAKLAGMFSRRVLFILSVVLALAACSVSQEVFISSDSSGRVSVRIQLEEVFVEYLFNLAQVAGDVAVLEEGTIFDLEEIQNGVQERPGVRVTQIDTPKPEILETSFTFENVEDIFGGEAELQEAGIIRFSQSNAEKKLEIYLDRKNYQQLSSMFPVLANPVFESLGPQEGDTTTEDEYLEIMEFALGEAGPEVVKNSFIEVVVRTDGEIISQRGGTLQEGTATFRIPLLRVLLLDQPLDFELVFK